MSQESFKERLKRMKEEAEQWFDENFDDIDDKAEDRLAKLKSWLKEKQGLVEDEARVEADRFSATMDKLDKKLEALAEGAEEDFEAFEADVKQRFSAFMDKFKSGDDDSAV